MCACLYAGIRVDVLIVDDLELFLAPDEDLVCDPDLVDVDPGVWPTSISVGSEQRPPWRSVLPTPHAALACGCPGVYASLFRGCLPVPLRCPLVAADCLT